MVTYEAAIAYLEASKTLGSRPGLDSIRALLQRMDNPEKKLRVLHIAGTNGKGSTGSFLSHILSAAGYRTGFFSSPAVYSPREMIRLNQEEISEQAFAAAISATKNGTDIMLSDGLLPPTEFEILTAAAYFVFAENQCDFVVAECGMGGRLDATNVVADAVASVLCRIDYDHMGFLGNTLTEITGEKCGIMRNGRPVVSYPLQEEEVCREIIRQARNRKCQLRFPELKKLRPGVGGRHGSIFSYGTFKDLEIPLCGEHQIYNALTALETILVLRENGIFISDKAVYEGLRHTEWLGRFEVLSEKPLVILDGAHNLNGVQSFVSTMSACYPEQKLVGVVGMLGDKDFKAGLAEFSKICNTLIVTEVANERTADVSSLVQAAEGLPVKLLTEKDPEAAVRRAFAMKPAGIFCAGSLYNLSIFKNTCLQRLKKC